ncbi:MAG: phosphotransferase [Ilumatobacteraceae bacterium]
MSAAETPFAERSTRSQVSRLRRVAERAVADYPFDVDRLRLVLHGYNTTFRVDTTDGRTFALRVNVNSRRADEHLAAEAAWLAALGADPVVSERIAVPVPVRTRDGSLRTTAWSDDLEADLPVLVTSWLPGRDLREPDSDGAFALGVATATLHDHAARWTLPSGADLPDVDDPIGEMVDVLLANRTITTADQRTVFAAVHDRVASSIAVLRDDPAIPVTPIHADLHGGNVKWFRRRIAVFDFDDSCIGTPVHDLAISLYYLRDDDPVEDALLAGYASVRPLPTFAPEQLEAIVAARNLVLAGDVLTMTTAEIRAMAPSYLARSVERLRAYLATGRYRHDVV